MSSLKSQEKVTFERLFDRGGWVLNFRDTTYAEFFREHRINIEDDKYRKYGTSKMKRLRAFWEMEPDEVVSDVLLGLLEYAKAIEDIPQSDNDKAMAAINRLAGKTVTEKTTSSIDDFLKYEFSNLNLETLCIDPQFQMVIKQRIEEIQMTLQANAPLATIFLCGSTLEGLLLDSATKQFQTFNLANSSPKNKEGKPKPLPDWTLDNLINVAHEVGLLSLDVKKYSHSLKDFRNFIHPRQQAMQNFAPDLHTAKISWQVLQAAIANLNGKRKK